MGVGKLQDSFIILLQITVQVHVFNYGIQLAAAAAQPGHAMELQPGSYNYLTYLYLYLVLTYLSSRVVEYLATATIMHA